MKRLALKTRRVVTMFPLDLYERMVRRAGQETTDRNRRVTPSDLVRWAIEEYLDTWETATLVADRPVPTAGDEQVTGDGQQ